MTVDKLTAIAWMDNEGMNIFQTSLKHATTYLEYGSGKSTEYACTLKNIKHVITVESDKSWCDEVYKNIINKNKLHLGYANIGVVGKFGRPINDDGFKSYHSYMIMPWGLADKYDLKPELILVDGRFRVACFLYSLLCADKGTVILFDDYFDRLEQYNVVEKFCKVHSKHGRMAKFIVEKDFNIPELTAFIAKYSVLTD